MGSLWNGAGLCPLLLLFQALTCICTLAGHLVDISEDAQDKYKGQLGSQEEEQ